MDPFRRRSMSMHNSPTVAAAGQSERRRSGSELRQRTRSIGIRLTFEEQAELIARAKSAGISTADWLRRAGLRRAIPIARNGLSYEAISTMRVIVGQLGRFGNNLNQIAHRSIVAEQSGRHLSPDLALLTEISDAMRDIRTELSMIRGDRDQQ